MRLSRSLYLCNNDALATDPIPLVPYAIGGIEKICNGYKYHIFYSDADLMIINGALACDAILVGGGGAGAMSVSITSSGGGGGGGGLIKIDGESLIEGTYPIVVGVGAAANPLNTNLNGGNSSFNGHIAQGGGGGGIPNNIGTPGSNEELTGDIVNEGDIVSYRGMEHPIKFGHNAKSNEKSKTTGFITHNGTIYLVAINGILLNGVTLIKKNHDV